MNHVETLSSSFIRLLKAVWYRSKIVLLYLIKKIWKLFKFILLKIKKFILHQANKHPGGTFSLALHIILILLLIGDISMLFYKPPERTETISVEMRLPISDKTNVKPKKIEQKSIKKPKPIEKLPQKPVKQVKRVIPKAKPISKPKKPIKKVDKKIDKKIAKFIPKPRHKPKKPTKQKPIEKIDKPLLKNLAKQETIDKKAVKKNNSSDFDPTAPLSMSEKDAIKYQIIQCWSIPAGARDVENIIVEVSIKYFKDGRLNGTPKLLNNRKNDNAYRIIAESVIRAINKCNPLNDLPADKYSRWKDIEFEFSPIEAF